MTIRTLELRVDTVRDPDTENLRQACRKAGALLMAAAIEEEQGGVSHYLGRLAQELLEKGAFLGPEGGIVIG